MNEITRFGAQFGNVEAEQQLLGGLMLRPEMADSVSDILLAEHFHDPLHARIYRLICDRLVKGHHVSPVAIAGVIGQDEGLRQLGGQAYLFRMAAAAIQPGQARSYAVLVLESHVRRLIQAAAQGAVDGLVAGEEAQEVRSRLEQSLQAVPEPAGTESTYSLLRSVTETVAQVAQQYQGGVSYLKTGVEALDAVLRGLAPGDLCLIGGATSMGKTSLALEIAGNVAVGQGVGVAFVSLEMSRHELVTRMASARARVPYSDLRDPSGLEPEVMQGWATAAQGMSEAPMRIIPKTVRDMPAIHAAARRARRELGGSMGLVVIDYAQLVRANGRSRLEQMVEVSIGMKALAGLLDVPVIGLVQLSRDIGHRDEKRPQLSDIKETGQFENDADQVVFCHREEYWMQRAGPTPNKAGEVTVSAQADYEAEMVRVKNKMELIVRKNRHGRLATAEVGFHAPTNRFWKLSGGRDVTDGF